MESVLSFRMLAVFALVLLVSSVNEGRVLRKCELKAQLEAAQFQVIEEMGNDMTVEDLIARFVCRVENTSEFNTSLVTSIQINHDEIRPQPEAEEAIAKENNDKKMVEEHIIPVQPQRQPKGRPERSITEAKIISKAIRGGKELFWTWHHGLFPNKTPTDSSGSHSEESSEEESSGDSSDEGLDDVITWNLFGILQLGDHVACDSGSNRTLNLCGLDCSALIDEDITDDVICLKTLAESHGKFNGFSHNKKFFAKMMAMLLSKECHSVIPSEYFAECGELSSVPMDEAST